MQNTDENQIRQECTCYLFRHGKTKGNSEHRYIGRSDQALSLEGASQIKEGTYPKVDELFTSPMLRARESARLMFPDFFKEENPLKKAREISKLREIDFGEFEGKTADELALNPSFQAWIDSNGSLPFPGGESREAFIERSLEGFKELLLASQRESRKIALVAHGGSIMAILSTFCQGDYFDYQIKNGRGYQFQLVFDREKLGQADWIKGVEISKLEEWK